MIMTLRVTENRASRDVRLEKTVAIKKGKCIRSFTQGYRELAG